MWPPNGMDLAVKTLTRELECHERVCVGNLADAEWRVGSDALALVLLFKPADSGGRTQ